MQLNQSANLSSSTKSFENLLKLIENTNNKHKQYLATDKNDNYNAQSSVIKHEINKCQQEYDKIVSNKVQQVSNNNDIMSLNCNINDIKQMIENKFIKIKTTKYNDEFIQKFGNIKFSEYKNDLKSYSICQFDSKCSKLCKGSTIDCDNKHIKIGSMFYQNCYSMILPDAKHMQGYSSGQHCFRMYYKNARGSHYWLFFGIYKYGIVPKDIRPCDHKTSWGIGDGGYGIIICNGEYEYDENMLFLYCLNENQIDMFVDFDKGILSYSLVDDKIKGRKYTFKKKFDTNIAYTVNVGFLWGETEVQIAKINVKMFGKNKKLIKWPIKKY